MKQSEKDTERYLVQRVKTIGGLCLKVDPKHSNGAPDRLILLPRGKVFFVETKSEGEEPRKLQKHVSKEIQKLGIATYVADTKERVDEILAIWGY